MFEEICLVCGKPLQDDAQAYCSEDCQNLDISSPSISSASSALSSPHLSYAGGGDVPALVPSALGSALTQYDFRSRDHFSLSSSSASSTSWSVLTDNDNDDDNSALGIGGYEYGLHDRSDSIYEGSSKSANFAYSIKSSALSYARRPSGTNNRSTVPHPHKRTSSGHVRDSPRSAPLHSLLAPDDDGGFSDFGFSSRDESEPDINDMGTVKSASATSKSKRSRNRASLPGYFSLLQMSSPADEKRTSPVSSSSGKTVARLSPPTPKVPSAGLVAGFPHTSSTHPLPSTHATPRGRRWAPGGLTDDLRPGYESSYSRSRSRVRRAVPEFSPRPLRSRLDSKSSVEQVFDWSSVPGLPRGRAAVRRNSSPPPKMMLSAIALEALDAENNAEVVAPGYRKTRGRAKAEELDGPGRSADAPGYGIGRSGLLDRERGIGYRQARLL